MPIYEYRCKACDHEMEAFQKLSDDPLKECPACGDLTLIKQISAAGFRLKGGGWYETDFKGSKDKKRNLAGGGESASGSASSEASKSVADSGSATASSSKPDSKPSTASSS